MLEGGKENYVPIKHIPHNKFSDKTFRHNRSKDHFSNAFQRLQLGPIAFLHTYYPSSMPSFAPSPSLKALI